MNLATPKARAKHELFVQQTCLSELALGLFEKASEEYKNIHATFHKK
jgi:hypothetical protein